MTRAVAVIGPVIVFAAVLLSALALAGTRRITAALPILLDLLLVAGLLRLSATGTWQAIASTATIVLIRKVATFGITAAQRAQHSST